MLTSLSLVADYAKKVQVASNKQPHLICNIWRTDEAKNLLMPASAAGAVAGQSQSASSCCFLGRGRCSNLGFRRPNIIDLWSAGSRCVYWLAHLSACVALIFCSCCLNQQQICNYLAHYNRIFRRRRGRQCVVTSDYC